MQENGRRWIKKIGYRESFICNGLTELVQKARRGALTKSMMMTLNIVCPLADGYGNQGAVAVCIPDDVVRLAYQLIAEEPD